MIMLNLLSFIIYIYLATGTIYLLVMALAGKAAKSKKFLFNPVKKRIAVLIPAYKEDSIIVDTAEKAANHNYPKSSYQVIVIADSLREKTLQKLRSLPLQVLEVTFNISTKARSIHAALQYLKKEYPEIVVVLDADNIMESNCLEKINEAFHGNVKAVQCHRTAKNQGSAIARLDAISEEININLFRRGPAAIGLSAMPLGSGMAFEFDIIESIFQTEGILENPAEDREIEIQLMKRNIKMGFLDNVFIYDEKVQTAAVFQKQRTRWLEAQLGQIRRFFKNDLKTAPRTPVYYHIFFQSLILPRLLFLIIYCVVFLLCVIQWLFNTDFLHPFYGWWLLIVITYLFVLLISIPSTFYNTKTLKAVAYIPLLTLSMVRAILKIKTDRKEFLHTPKTFSDKL